MARKIAKRVVRIAASEDESVHATEGPSGLGASEPQQETEKVAIPEGGEVQLQNSNILPDSLTVTELKTDKEFIASEDQSFGPGKYFFMPEEGTIFFDPSDAGKRVRIEYLWREAPADADESAASDDADDDEDDGLDVDPDEEEKTPRVKSSPSDSLWHLDHEWFKWKPLTKKITVNDALNAKLGKGVDIKRGIVVRNEKTGKQLPVSLSGVDKGGKPKKMPSPGEVVYNYGDGDLYWGDQAASGNTYIIEYFLKGEKGTPLTMEGEENEEAEYNLVESFKSRAENLWTHILDNPDPAFVRDTILPIIEDEIESAREKILSMDSEPKKEEALKSFPDLTGEFMELEQLLAKREESDDADTRRTARDFIESDIAPKLGRFYSLASLLSERIYDIQTESAKDEDFPEFEGGARSIDVNTLKYLKKVRQEANNLDRDLVDFSKFYTGLLIKWITDPDTYYPTSAPKKSKKKDPRWEGIKEVFERAGVGMADLQAVALEAFRRAILEFDRDKRNKEKIPDPKKFRIYGSPLIQRRVTNALKRVFDKYQREQTVESTTRSGSSTVEIPADGGEVDLKIPGLRVEDLQIKGEDGRLFTSARGVLRPTQAEGRKSPRVKIMLGKGLDKDAPVSLTVPETGTKLSIIRSKDHPWNADLKKKVAEDPNVFYFAHSSGTLWLSETYRGRSLLVEAPGLGGDGAIGKDQYRAHPTRGTIEFSSQNAGEKVEVSYSQTVRSKRYVNPVVKSDDEEGEATSLIDMQEDEGADPLAKAEEALSQENVDKLLDVIGEILTVEEDPRLSEEDRIILQGLLGIGEAGGQRLTIQEIAAREPFNVDVSDSNKLNQIKTKRQKAANSLLEILREKAEEDKSIRKMVRPFEAVLLGKDAGQDIQTDKFLGYLNKDAENAKSFQNVLVGVLGRANLKQDEENILRWMWALPGNLRRDQDSEEKQHEVLPNGLAPADSPGARLQEIAIDEFGIEADDDGNISHAATSVINKVYERALKKFEDAFNKVYEGRKEFFSQKFPDFITYYDRQIGKQSLRDELAKIEQDEYKVPPEAAKRPQEEKTPLFDQIKKSVSGDEAMLRSLMEELLATHQKGGSIHDLIKQREKDVDALTQKGANLLESRTKDLRAEIEELKKASGQARAEIEKIDDVLGDALKQREKLREQVVSENSDVAKKKKQVQVVSKILNLLSAWETSALFELLSPKKIDAIEDPDEKKIYETYSYLRNASGDDLEEAQTDIAQELEEHRAELKELRKKAVELAGDEVRKGLRQLKQKIEELTSKKEKFTEVAAKQEAALDTKKDELKNKLGPLQKKLEEHLRDHNATKELATLQKVYNFLSDREDLQRGDGSFSLDHMFELPKPEKGKGYQAPKLAPGEEDTYKPLPRKEVGPAAAPLPKPSGLPEPSDEVQQPKPPKAPKPSAVPSDEREDKSKFAPPAKQAPTETTKSLFEELQSVAVKVDPEESQKDYKTRLENFRTLMTALRKHFAEGKSIRDFKPKFSASQTLPDQNKVLRAVIEYLRDFATDLKQGPGVWDLKNLFNPTIVKPIESLEKKVDLSDSDAAIESLMNSQPSLTNKGHAKSLHEMMRILNRGTPISKIIKGLRSSGNPNADSTLNLALRLAYFMSLNEDLKKDDSTWNFQPLYTGAKKFPSFEEYDRSRPLVEQMAPLVKSIQNQLKEEAGKDGGVESVSATEERVRDILHRMSEMALHGMDLDQMQAEFEKEDKKGAKAYSLAYLFQQARNFINRLNRTKGLANMRDDLGLADVFGPGAPAGSLTEQSEVKAPTEEQQEQLMPEDDRTSGFREMLRVMSMDEKEAAVAHQLVAALQLRMESSNKPAAELLAALLQKNPKFGPIVKKVLSFIGANRSKFESGIPGMPDLSYLTGMPFKHPAAETPAPEPEAPASEATPSEGIPSVDEILKEKVTQAPNEQRRALRKSIFNDFVEEHQLDEDEANLFADAIRALKENIGGIAGDNKIINATKGTAIHGTFELLFEFFREKGLVHASGYPDFRGVVIPPLGDRESFFNKDGSPNLERINRDVKDMSDFDSDDDDVSDEMPEPRADLDEHADELTDELGGRGTRFAPDLQEAVDFLKSDQVITDEDGPRDTAKERLKKNIWNMMVQEFDFDAEEQQNAAEILEAIQKTGLDKIKARLKGPAAVLLDDLVDYIKEQGLDETDIVDIKLPTIKATEEQPDEVGLSIEELMGEQPKEKAPSRLTPTVRKEVDEDTLLKTLDAAQKAQGKGLIANLFDAAEVIRGLEGKVDPEDAKNALLQAAENGYVELRPETGANSLSAEEAKFVPVTPDGVPLSSGRVLRMPESKAAPTPAAPAAPASGGGTRGRLPAALVDRASGARIYDFIVKHSGLTKDEASAMSKAVPGIADKTYRQIAELFKSEGRNLPQVAQGAVQKYIRGFTSYLRLVQQGKDPLAGSNSTPAPAARPAGEWRNDPATEKQIRKVQELFNELQDMGAADDLPPVSIDPSTKGEAADSINALKQALEEAKKKQKAEETGAPATAPAQSKTAPESRAVQLKALLTKDSNNKARLKRLRALQDLGAYSFDEIREAIQLLEISDADKQKLLSTLPGGEAPAEPKATPAAPEAAKPEDKLDQLLALGKQLSAALKARDVAKAHELAKAVKAFGKVSIPANRSEARRQLAQLRQTAQWVTNGGWEQRMQEKGETPAPAKTQAPAAQPAKAPSKAPDAPAGDRGERAKLQALLEKALDWSSKNEVYSAQGFKLLLNKQRPDLVPMYEKIMPQVQKALDAIHGNSLDFDLSDL
jgi:hypothetical protein